MNEHKREIRSYVLRGGRLTALQERALTELSDRYCIPYGETPLDPDEIFDHRPVVVEVGFGNGDATVEIAKIRPEYGYLGIEVFPPGVGNVLHQLDVQQLYNIKIIRYDAVAVFERMLPPAGLAGIHLFFPDPWPKKRHHKRRIIQPSFVSLAASRLKRDGYFYAVTDWQDYAEWMLSILANEPELENTESGFCTPRSWRPETRFERKAREKGHEIYELFFKKRR